MTVAADHVALRVDTPDGPYDLECDWLLAADGARSLVRRLLGLEFIGQTVRDRFLVCDVETDADFPNMRHFWFDPPFHRRALGAAAPPARQSVAHRPATGLVRRPGGRAVARAGRHAAAAHPRRAGRIPGGIGRGLHVPVPPAGAVRPRAGAVRRRRRPPGLALRRARRQFRRAGRRQSGLEAAPGAGRAGTGGAAGQLRPRAGGGRRREPARRRARGRVHRPALAHGTRPARRRPAPGRQVQLRRTISSTAAGCREPTVYVELAAEHAGRPVRPVRRRRAAGGALHGRAGGAAGQGGAGCCTIWGSVSPPSCSTRRRRRSRSSASPRCRCRSAPGAAPARGRRPADATGTDRHRRAGL